jgi:hypothetical protein
VSQVQQVHFEGKNIILCLRYCLGLFADGMACSSVFTFHSNFDNLATLTAMRGAGSRVSRLAAERRPGSCSVPFGGELSGMLYRHRQTET